MKIKGKSWQTIWLVDDTHVEVIDQTNLPHKFITKKLLEVNDFFWAIKNMVVRGAPLIGVTGAYGLAFSIKRDASEANIKKNKKYLESARPTAVNLKWALDRVYKKIHNIDLENRFIAALKEAQLIEKEDVAMSSEIGENGLKVLRNIYKEKLKKEANCRLNILTHCNAGWLATVDWGTALAPIYKAVRQGINLHVWVDETRPRNQGASLTAYELKSEGISHSVIVDNAGGFLMQNNMVDVVIVGSDRTTSTGDVCNKIGTYLKALAAYENNIPFYVALPISTIDWDLDDGVKTIPIEERNSEEVQYMSGIDENGELQKIGILPKGCNAYNPAFDVTPAKYVTGLITEKGVCEANKSSLKNLYNKF